MKLTNPEAVILGALFDFAGHLRTSDIINPLAGIDGFAKQRKLTATEVPTLTWRDQLDTLRDSAENLPRDSDLVRDLLTLAEVFKDTDPGADNGIFDLLHNTATRLRRLGDQPEPEPEAKPEPELTDEAQEDRDAFESYSLKYGCSCHISPPCGHCTHPGNPLNQEDPSCWKVAP